MKLACLLLVARLASGATLYVTEWGGGNRDGSSWSNACDHPQEAMNRADWGDEIWVAKGWYYWQSDQRRLLEMKHGVALYGGFGGNETSRDQRDWRNNETGLDGMWNVYHVVVGASDATLDGFRITSGTASSGGGDEYGGGMYNWYVFNLTVANCTFDSNSADWGCGGGMYNNNTSNVTVSNCTFRMNSALYYGGGMYNYECSPTVTGCLFDGNWTNDATYGGGGMCNDWYGEPTVTDCVFVNNSAYRGGGMCNMYYGSPDVTDCVFVWNNSTYGGGMCNYESSPQVARCAFRSNSTSYGGGMCNEWSSSPTVENCTFYNNWANQQGGGIHNYEDSRPNVTNCTFYMNAAGASPGGDGLCNTSGSYPYLANCILWDDSADEIYDEAGSFSTVNYSDVWGGWAGAGGDNINALPTFVSQTYGNLRLRKGSPGIDQGTSAGAPSDDFDGNPRPYDGLYDMGAFEYQGQDTYIWYVVENGYGGGGSWRSALNHPQKAIEEAWVGNEIWVAQGTYWAWAPSAGVAMKDSVSMYGGFAGTETARSDRDPKTNVTTLDGQDWAYHVVVAASSAALDGFTITNGWAWGGAFPDYYGGGVYVPDSTSGFSLANCVVSDNYVSMYGGGMYNGPWSDVKVENCTFSENNVDGSGGGGMYNGDFATVIVTSCVFVGNDAPMGGGMYNTWDASATVTNCTFYDNQANQEGGGIYCSVGSWGDVVNCILWNDWASSGTEIYDASGSWRVRYSDVGQMGGFWDDGWNINADPFFTNAGAMPPDLHLSKGSPCIDAADGGSAPQTDIEGNERYDDPKTDNTGSGSPDYADMGAYEYPKPALRLGILGGGCGAGAGASLALVLFAVLAMRRRRRINAA